MPRLFRASAVAALACTTLSLASFAQTNGQPERFTAMAVNMDRGAAGTVEIVINRWSTDAERDRLLSTLMDKGPEKLLDVLQDMPRAGYFRTPDSIAWDVHYGGRPPIPDGGEGGVLAPVGRTGFWKARNGPRPFDY